MSVEAAPFTESAIDTSDVFGLPPGIPHDELQVGDSVLVEREFVYSDVDGAEAVEPFEPIDGVIEALPSRDEATGQRVGALLLRPYGEEKLEHPDGSFTTRPWPTRALRLNDTPEAAAQTQEEHFLQPAPGMRGYLAYGSMTLRFSRIPPPPDV